MTTTTYLTACPGSALKGIVRAPGDKSISHRSLILGAMATGITEIEGLLEGEDILATARAVEAFGATVERRGPGHWRVEGRGGFTSPDHVIDCGNAGTGVRLLMGAAAGYPITATFDGDASLRKRPMKRVTGPLAQMGARFDWQTSDDRLPVTLSGGALSAISYEQTVASAQIKSAILLAGLNAEGTTTVTEPEKSRDHTERMLRAFGAEVGVESVGDGWRVSLIGGQRLNGTAVSVPGDPSSAAFPLAAGLIVPGAEVTVEGVMLNPLRTGLFDSWIEMGADLTITNRRSSGGEEVGDITARHSHLKGIVVPENRAASMIDEYPILAATAAFAEGATVMRGIGEMRVKESDRIALMSAGLKACGVQVEEEPEGFIVTGGRVPGGATVTTHGDHRIAMSHLVLGLAAQAPVTIDEPGMIATSFPGFVEMMQGLGARVEELDQVSPIDDNSGLELVYGDDFLTWRSKLRDLSALARIASRLDRLSEGHWGDAKSVGGGVIEVRLHFGPGYRVYVKQQGRRIVVLLCGGDKSSQSRDIALAQTLAVEIEDAS